MLSSSARVSQVTYQTVVGVRYPELVEQTSAGWRFGRFVSPEEPLRGGFLPVFWDVPRARTLSLDKEFLDSNQPSDFTGTFVSQKFR